MADKSNASIKVIFMQGHHREMSFSEMNQHIFSVDINAVKWYAQELIDASYFGKTKSYIMDMESYYRAAYRAIIGYTDEAGRYIDGWLDAPFWTSVEEALCSCIRENENAALRHPDNNFYPAVVSAAYDLIDYLHGGYEETGD